MLARQVTSEVHTAAHLRSHALKVSPHLGSVLVALRKAHPDLKVTALAFNPAHVDVVSRLGAEVVQGSFSDTNLITLRACESDITINTASSDDVELTNAILDGPKGARRRGQEGPRLSFCTRVEWRYSCTTGRKGRTTLIAKSRM
jgi:hypothetical protein